MSLVASGCRYGSNRPETADWQDHSAIAAAKEEDWEYEVPKLGASMSTVMVSLDGAMIPMADSAGYREAMVGTLAQARYPQRHAEDKRSHWRHQQCTELKHDRNSVDRLIAEAATLSSRRTSLSQTLRDAAYSAWTYFNNHRHQMDYPGFLAEHLPIGSGVTEAARKTLVKQRLCASGMRWKTKGAKIILSLRSLV
ncbi:MAG: hypothetical protein WAK53_12075, partial [Chromatiaceae bacterium]